jgi:glucan phosphoethanolaminetransferase (alkaline phosphatase superfamily)
VWRKLAPVHGLLFLISFYLVLSLGYIIFYSQTFRLGKRIVVLHLAVVCGLILATVLCIGLLLLFRRFREWRFARFLVSLVPAAGYSALVTLYFVDYIANKMWGNNVTYELAAQYILGGGLFQKELQMLPGQVYLFWIGVLIVIFSVHARLSAPLFSSLKALFLPGEGPAVFRRALSAAAAISLSLFFIGFIGFQLTRAEPRYRDRIISREPVLGFFIDSRGLIEFADVRKNLAAAEAGIRKSYPSGQPFEKKNVVVILVDSLRADRMQIYGYERPTTPFLKSLVETGHIKQVEIATSTCSDTICGVLSILSSHTLGRQTPQNFKLQDLLHDQGYNVYFILSSNHSWYSLKKSYGTSLTYFFDGTRSERYQWSDDRVIFEGLEGVPDYTDTPAFFYFHLMSPHPAGVKHEGYSKYQPARNWVEFSGGDYDVVSSNNYYDNGAGGGRPARAGGAGRRRGPWRWPRRRAARRRGQGPG